MKKLWMLLALLVAVPVGSQTPIPVYGTGPNKSVNVLEAQPEWARQRRAFGVSTTLSFGSYDSTQATPTLGARQVGLEIYPTFIDSASNHPAYVILGVTPQGHTVFNVDTTSSYNWLTRKKNATANSLPDSAGSVLGFFRHATSALGADSVCRPWETPVVVHLQAGKRGEVVWFTDPATGEPFHADISSFRMVNRGVRGSVPGTAAGNVVTIFSGQAAGAATGRIILRCNVVYR